MAKLTCVLMHGKRWVWSQQLIVDVYDNWQIAWRCFSASEVQNDDKKKAWDNGGVRERDHSVYMWKLWCKRGAFAPPPWLCVSRSSQSRAEHRKSISFWTSATCLVPVPAATSRSDVFLSDVPSAPDHEAVLQAEEGVMSAVVEMRYGAACKYKYRLYREGRPLDKEEDKEVSPSLKRELILDELNEPG